VAYTVNDGAILEVSFRGQCLQQRTISLFHYRFVNTVGPLDGLALINAINPLLNANAAGKLLKDYMDACQADFFMEQIVYQWISPTRRPRIVKLPAIANGTVVGTAAPPNIAVALTKKTDIAGRRGVGTLHMPALNLEGLNGGEINLLQIGLYGNLLNRLAETVVIDFGETLEPVLLHRADPAASPHITTANANLTVRTMHRRTVGLGE
jgi:hypothetical protein